MENDIAIHQQMIGEIRKRIQSEPGYTIPKSMSLPFDCTRDERLCLPDVVVMMSGNITHIVEPETGTGGATICGKIVLINKSLEIMVNNGKQSPTIKPKLIFLYKPGYPANLLNRIKYRVEKASIRRDYLGELIIDRFPASWKWF